VIKIVLSSLLGALILSSNLFADLIIEKDPNDGLYAGLGGGVSSIYADSFIFTGTTGTTLDTLGVWLLGGADTSTLDFELMADTGSDAPDPTNILTSSGAVSFNVTSLTLETETVTPVSLTNGVEYWVAIAVVSPDGAYSLAQHTQNTEGIDDDGTFWYSNDPTEQTFARSFATEMAIYAADSQSDGSGGSGGLGGTGSSPTATPEPATWGCMLVGLGALAVRFRSMKRI